MTSQTTPTQQKKRSEVFLRQQLTQAPQANEDVLFPPSPPHCSKASVTPRAQSPVSRPHPYYYPPRAAPQPRRAPAALLREHTPVLTLSRRRRFRKRTKRNPDGADAGPPAEPRTGTAETGGEAARALQPGRAAPLPPARRGGPRTAPRPGEAPRAGPERVAPESRRRKARPRPLPARPPRTAASACRAEEGPCRKGPPADGLPDAAALAATAHLLLMVPNRPRRQERPSREATAGSHRPQPAPFKRRRAACWAAPRLAPPPTAPCRAVPEQSALWRPLRSYPQAAL